MSAGSGASNSGYSNVTPYSNINGNFVNKYSSNNPASFGSNEVSGLPGLAGSKNNVDAAAGIVPGICLFKGGARRFKKKIKNITKRYKRMSRSRKSNLRKKLKSLKGKLRSVSVKASLAISGGRRHRRKSHTSRRKYKQRGGGYGQYQNNEAISLSYSTGGKLSPSLSALANPVPIDKVMNAAVDNLNAYTMKGFPSPGH
jgi:hypothetical protein